MTPPVENPNIENERTEKRKQLIQRRKHIIDQLISIDSEIRTWNCVGDSDQIKLVVKPTYVEVVDELLDLRYDVEQLKAVWVASYYGTTPQQE